MTRRSTTEEFIQKAKAKHGDRYQYDNVEYVGNRTKVTIICKKHGGFEMIPNSHLAGRGCPLCANEAVGERCRMSNEDFVKKSVEVHGDTYGYSCVDYIDSKTKVKIVCKRHGCFDITPNSHIRGHGCPRCQAEKTSLRCRSNTEEFIKRATAAHGDRYDYRLVEYKSVHSPVKIVCKEHGVFLQAPSNHYSGVNCPSCARGFKQTIPAVVYVFSIQAAKGVFTGYGISGNYKRRLQQHTKTLTKHSAHIDKMFSIHFDTGAQAAEVETLIKQTFPLCEHTSNIEGFKTESTTATFSEVVAFVEKIKGEMDNGCTRPN